MRMCYFWAQNGPFVLNKFFLVQLLLSSFYWPFSLCKIKKKLLKQIQSYEVVPFLGPKWSICPKQIFFGKLLISLSSTYYPLSLCKLLKTFFQQIQSYEDVQFLDPKWPICLNGIFFRKPVNEPCSSHSCLSPCEKSKSDINLLVKYWRLKSTEI